MSIFKTPHALMLAIALAVNFSATVASAQQSGERRGPPPEAIEACVSLAEGDSCEFTGPSGEANGQCMAAPHNPLKLACIPEGGPELRGVKK